MLKRTTATELQLAASIEELADMPRNPIITGCIESVKGGFRLGQVPVLTGDGTSGTYFLRDKKEEAVAVFKPIDEEPFAPNNPRGMRAPFGSDTCRPGVKSGELTVREVIAYMLDHESFADVPATTLAKATHPTFLASNYSSSDQIDCGQNLNWSYSTETKQFKTSNKTRF